MAVSSAAEILRARALAFLDAAPLGTRVVVRAHDGSGARDALGELTAREPARVSVLTRRGVVTIERADVIAAKAVPPRAMPRRAAR